ncbi:class I SAM-dependent methyltransferase [Novosphingobium huizhouense]|uniref:class I SAM-dependent methyltransferase n=1 Tax=Novosphingobium huizhouense TaxID=2866625 RepID=UPI001CD8C454|nr:class I SAM-dependent methyltransferase [Novosphingobium huizhouense]
MASAVRSASPAQGGHGALMDAVYRRQKHIYDATRKYYLFGRDSLIGALDAPAGTSVLEVGCGTGRNLALIGKRWPGALLHGLDISSEMLSIADEKLGHKAVLALGDATDFDPASLFGRSTFDRVVISYAVSMIPVWREAIAHAATLLAPGGSLHIVDFGDLGGLPGPLRAALRAWLASFHVTPRTDLGAALTAICEDGPFSATTTRGALGYFQIGVLTRNA